MKVVVTGGTGFIGAHVCRELLNDGHQVVAYESSPVRERVKDLVEDMEIVEGDVTDLALLARVFKHDQVSHVVHLAAFLPEIALRGNPSKALRANGEGTNNVFEAALANDVHRVVYASSDGVCPLTEAEDSPVRPRSVYGVLKYVNEIMAGVYKDDFGLSTIGLRFVVNYGPGGRLLAGEVRRGYPSGRTFSVLEAVMGGGTVVAEDSGTERSRWMYVKDTARLVTRALKADTDRRVINVAGHPTTLAAAIAEVQAQFPDAGGVQFSEESSEAPLADYWYDVDPSEAKAALGFETKWTLPQGLREYTEWVRESSGVTVAPA